MPRQQRLRWAIVGVGVAGRARAGAIEKDPRAVLVAVHRGRFAHEVEAPEVASVDDAVQAADCVAVCSPAEAHPDQIRAALESGRHVLVEYPLVRDPTLARELYALADERQVVLHVEHIELLGPIPHTLRALVTAPLIERLHVAFEGPGPADLDPFEVAWKNVARLHRALDLAGPVREVVSVSHQPGQVEATLRLHNGAPLTLSFGYAPMMSRRTRMRVDTPGAVWEQTNDSLTRNGTPQTLLGTGSLFKLDQLAATARILDSAAPYVDEARILHVLDVVDAIATQRIGAVLPASS